MAKSYSIAEVVKAINTNDKATLMILGKRVPLTLCMLITASKSEDASRFLEILDFVSTRKIEMGLRGGIVEPEDDDIEDPVAKAEEKKEAPKAKGKKPVEKKAPAKTAKKATKPMNEPEENDDPDYESMSEVELFKVCKAKGLKPAPKQKKEYYLELLSPADEPEDDDWEEEEAKPAKKAPAKKATSKKKAVEEDDDDDWDI